MGLQASDKAGGSSPSRPKVERQGRREIGRALEAFYDDVVRQGVPAPILELLADLDARTGSRVDSDRP
jgi:protein involved in polysaccharide export with SLBB domain